MASAISHALVAVTMGRCVYRNQLDRKAMALGALCAIVPDLDVIGFSFGVPYEAVWGHRGITHSLVFAGVLSAALVVVQYRGQRREDVTRAGLYFFLCAASHGVLDAMTNGGLGVAFFSPFDTGRYVFGVHPILVSPIGIREFLGVYGLQVLLSEATWIWLPSLALLLLLRLATMGARTTDPLR